MDMIWDFIAAYGAWVWVFAGLVLLALELVVPGGFLLWLGVAGIVTGLVALLQPIDWPLQWGLFGALSIVAITAWVRFQKSRPPVTDRPYLNRRADRYIGHETVLESAIVDGFGRVTLGDTIWRISGPDLPAGTRVRIVGAQGAMLTVEPAAPGAGTPAPGA